MSIEAMKQALEALEIVNREMLTLRDELAECGGRPSQGYHQLLWDSSHKVYTDTAIPAAEAIREALAQPAQEPVACVGTNGELMWLNKPKVIYSKPIPLYTTPPQRKPLTKTRVGNYLRRHVNGDVGMYRNGFKDGVRFAEAAHGIKGEA